MSHKTSSRIFAGLTVFLCAVVLLISLVTVIGTWVGGRAASNAALQLLDGIDKTAGTARTVIARVNTGVAQARDEVSSLEAVTAQIGQNVNDKGLVLTLLPPGREDALTAKVQQFVDDFNAVRDVIVSTVELYRTVNALPFVNLPKPESEKLQTAADFAAEVVSTAQALKDRIVEFRSNAAGVVSRVTDTITRVKDQLNKIEADLNTVDAQLLAVQTRVAQLRKAIPIAITVAMILITLLAAWVAYTQITVMRGAWRRLRMPDDSPVATLPGVDVTG
jgi:hypothetical protein